MKKYLFSVLIALSLGLTACAHDQIITVEQLPQPAQTLISTHFADDPISYVMQDREGFSLEYEVRLASGTKVDFDSKGELKKVDCDLRPVPEALIPESVRAYVQKMFPNAFITEWGKDDRRWKAELNNGLDLEFNNQYQFVRVDD
ncbi:MAG: PepSY-like domain-containing protein [Paludibacteraceae bacterium]|nr:PepSY-like domain-containing protein [Paludibacteraceae bacterium]